MTTKQQIINAVQKYRNENFEKTKITSQGKTVEINNLRVTKINGNKPLDLYDTYRVVDTENKQIYEVERYYYRKSGSKELKWSVKNLEMNKKSETKPKKTHAPLKV